MLVHTRQWRAGAVLCVYQREVGLRGSACVWGAGSWMFIFVCWHAVPLASRCVHVCSRARRLLNICFAGPWGVQLAELPALVSDSSSAASRSVNFPRVNS